MVQQYYLDFLNPRYTAEPVVMVTHDDFAAIAWARTKAKELREATPVPPMDYRITYKITRWETDHDYTNPGLVEKTNVPAVVYQEDVWPDAPMPDPSAPDQ